MGGCAIHGVVGGLGWCQGGVGGGRWAVCFVVHATTTFTTFDVAEARSGKAGWTCPGFRHATFGLEWAHGNKPLLAPPLLCGLGDGN